MSKFIEECKKKLNKWISLEKIDLLLPDQLSKLSLNYFLGLHDLGDDIHQKLEENLKQINNLVSKEEKKIEFLKQLSKLLIIDTLKFMPLLMNPVNHQFIYNFPGVSNINRDELFQIILGVEKKTNPKDAQMAYNLFSIQFITAALSISRCVIESKEFEVEVNQALLKEISDLSKDHNLTNLKKKISYV